MNPFFWLENVDMPGFDFVFGPMLVECRSGGGDGGAGPRLAVEYLARQDRYRLSLVRECREVEELIAGEPSREMRDEPRYLAVPHERVERLGDAAEPSRMAEIAAAALRASAASDAKRRDSPGAPRERAVGS